MMLDGLLLWLLWATANPSVAERDAIRAVLSELNEARLRHRPEEVARLFTAEGEIWSAGDRIAHGASAIAKLAGERGPWTEVTSPVLVHERIRLLSPDAAVVDAIERRYGSMIGRSSVPVMVILKKEAGEWRVDRYSTTTPFSFRIAPVTLSKMVPGRASRLALGDMQRDTAPVSRWNP